MFPCCRPAVDSSPTAGTSPFLSRADSAASWPTSGVKETVFGVPNNSGIDFNSKALPFYWNSSSGSSGAFGVPPNPGFGTNTSAFGLPKDTSQKTGIWPTQKSLLSSTMSGFDASNSPFKFKFTQAPGIQGSTVSQWTTASKATSGDHNKGSKVSSYVPTYAPIQEFGREKILSISGMETYKGKSHEELRVEDYELHNKGGLPAGFKPSDPQWNVFQFPSSLNKSSFNPPVGPFKSNPFAPKSDDTICKPSPFEPSKSNPFAPKQEVIVTPKAFPFEALKPNPFAVRSQDSVASDDKIIKPSPFEPFKSNPFAPKQQVLVTSDTTSKAFQFEPFKPNPFARRSQDSVASDDKIIKPSPFESCKSNPFAPTQQRLVTSDTTCKAFPIGPFKPNPFDLRSQNSVSLNDKIAEPSPFAPKQQDLVTTSDTTSKAFQFEPFKPNPFDLKPQDSFTSNDKITKPSPSEPFFNPFVPKQQDLVTPSDTNSTTSQPTHNALSTPIVGGSPMTAQPTSVPLSDPWPFARHGSEPGQFENPIQTSRASDGFTRAKEVYYQNINGQQLNVLSSTVGQKSLHAVAPFSMLSATDQPRDNGISSLPASNRLSSKKNNLSTNRSPSLLRIRHVSLRKSSLPASRLICTRSEAKVPFFCDDVDRPCPVGPFMPRPNPKAWITNSLSLHSSSGGKACEKENTPNSSIQDSYQDQNPSVTEKTEADILSLMPKLPDGEDYYTQPSLTEIASKEKYEPGSCTRVDGFVFGRTGFGSIRFFGQTDVRNLDLGSIVQFNKRELIVYGDNKKKPPVGQGLNKPAEVTLLKIKCTSKKTGKQYVDGPQVQSYREMLVKMAREQGAEFVSYDPVRGEWKFRVQSF